MIEKIASSSVIAIPNYKVGKVQLALMSAYDCLQDKVQRKVDAGQPVTAEQADLAMLWELLVAIGYEGNGWNILPGADRARTTAATADTR
jgi:hypothetical protein